MRALAVFPSTRETRLIDHPEPTIERPTDVKLRILEAGICGTDREITSFEYGEPPADSPYLIIGHEALGEVVEVGGEVAAVTPGDLAVLTVRRPCPHERSTPCRHGRQAFCLTGDVTREVKGVHGDMAEFVVDDEQYVVKVPRERRDVAVLVEPLTVAEKAAERVRVLAQRLPGNLKRPQQPQCRGTRGRPHRPAGSDEAAAGWVQHLGLFHGRSGQPERAGGGRYRRPVRLRGRTPARRPGEDCGNISLMYEATGVATSSSAR